MKCPLIRELFKKNKLNLVVTVIAALMGALGNIIVSWLIKEVIDFISGDSRYRLGIIIFVTIGGILIILASGILDYIFLPKFRANAMQQYRTFAFNQLLKKSIGATSAEGGSLYLSSLSNDVNIIEEKLIVPLQNVLQTGITFLAALALMLWYSPLLTLITLFFSVFPIFATIVTGNRAAEAEKELSDRKENYTGFLKDILMGFAVVKSFKAEKSISKEYDRINDSIKTASQIRYKINVFVAYAASLSGAIMQLGVFIAAALLSLSDESITAGLAIVFVQLINYILEPIQVFPNYFVSVKASTSLAKKLMNALEKNNFDEGKQIPCELTDTIKLKNLSYEYEEGKAALLNINMNFKAGECYAIVGSSGSGKSTILRLLLGYSHNYNGEILYDEKELREISYSSLYDLVSVIQQDVFIFNNTIRNNITMFGEFPKEEVDCAISLSGLKRLIDEKGENYLCGENGSMLSGGEKQRISIARALLRRTQVLLVDEGTSSLDSETSVGIMREILNLNGYTRIIVTHDLNKEIMQHCTGLYVLNNGRLVEQGTFENLMEKKDYFYSLFTISKYHFETDDVYMETIL